MLSAIKNKILNTTPFLQLGEEINKIVLNEPLSLKNINGSLLAFLIAFLFEKLNRQIFVILPTRDQAEKLKDDCAVLFNQPVVHLYACEPGHVGMLLDMSAPIAQIETLSSLVRSEPVIVIASAEALATKLPKPESFYQSSIELEVNKEYAFEELIRTLAELGFERKDFVDEYGDYAVRGGILDVFPFVGDNPIRLEFCGDRIESIREFDVLSQRSIRELNKTLIAPGLDSTNKKILEKECSIFDYLSSSAVLLLNEPSLIEKEIIELLEEGYTDVFDWREIKTATENFLRIIHSAFREEQLSTSINFHSLSQPIIGGSIKRLIQELYNLSVQGYDIYIGCDGEEEKIRLNDLIEEELTAPNGGINNKNSSFIEHKVRTEQSRINLKPDIAEDLISIITPKILPNTFHSGFIYHDAKIAFFTEHEIFGRLKRRESVRRRRYRGITQKELIQLHHGDFVVHQDYGIGMFAGLKKIKVKNIETEVMKLIYKNNDILYVNLNFVNRVQKYSSQEGHIPKLSRLGGPEWDRLKLRAKSKVKDIARDLIKIYARRKHEKGFAFSPDTHWQKEMEASFMYEDTPDQARTTIEVKHDMEQPTPMDRLVCGDVGYGKTEIAVRAAFKAVMNNKQVAVLAPTTILAQQHFNTFMDRLGKYSVQIQLLSRFRSKKEQNIILQALSEGKLDMIIGTHRMLSKDVKFKDLGLLIIDEEHRFGVEAKEKLRLLRASVDTLILTATPIPRTLQFSLMGARDLSLINTPPRNRIPVITEIVQFNPQIIYEAIKKELHRGGQVFFVHDRVNDIENMKSMLENLVPDAKFHIAHGQMKTRELEKTMMEFLEKKYDVLVCTKIIEAGIDIPNVNTILINRADRFGLAELYQLRGRVGRSNVQAYAYLLTPPFSVLPRISLRRLQAIQEFVELGSGFNLAMRDLEIRGAGNLLGREQTGFILEMGFEMYQRIVEEAVAELKEEEFKEQFEPTLEREKYKTSETIVETDIEAYIPEFYIEQDSERLDIYRRLYLCKNTKDIDLIRNELQDRFGEYPPEVENLMQLIQLKILASQIGVSSINLNENVFEMVFPPSDNKSFYEGNVFQKIIKQIEELKEYSPKIVQEDKRIKLVFKIRLSKNTADKLDLLKKIIEHLSI